MRFISKDDVARLAPYKPLIQAIAKGLLEPIESPPRIALNPNHDVSAVLIMPAWRPHGILGTKIVSIWPGNNAKGQPAVSAVYVVTSCDDGQTLAVIDGTELTLRRTAAAAALGSQLLARPNSKKLAVLGTGALSMPLVMAHLSILDLSEITIWGRSLDNAQAIADALSNIGISANATSDLQQTLGNADIVAAATTATQPFIRSEWVKPGTHLSLMGAFTPNMAEAEPQLLPKTRLFVDSREAVMQKGGEVLQALQKGLIVDADVRGELADLLAISPKMPGRMTNQDITVFKSVGFAALDLFAAEHILQGLLQT